MLNIVSRSVYQIHPTGPKKVVDNLIKGLKELGVPYVLNKHPFDCAFTWIHDDPSAIQYLFENNASIGNTQFIFGPNTFYTPEEIIWQKEFSGKESESPLQKGTYIMPSEWVMTYWRKHGFATPAAIWPVGVDTEFFKPDTDDTTAKRSNKVLVYTKRRDEQDVKAITDFLEAEKVTYSLFSYGSYSEEELIEAGKTSKFGIIIGSSESQGLAIQELLSLNLPLVVFDIEYLNQTSYIQTGEELNNDPASSVPFWSPECGLIAKTPGDMQKIIFEMIHADNLNERFSPREFIIQNFSLKKQAGGFLQIMKYPLPSASNEQETSQMRNWKNRTWYRPILALKYGIKYLLFVSSGI